jgi:hypothetical protein
MAGETPYFTPEQPQFKLTLPLVTATLENRFEYVYR